MSSDMQAFTRLQLAGLDPERHFLLDNQVYRGPPGVHVLTPFQDSASGTLAAGQPRLVADATGPQPPAGDRHAGRAR